MRLWFKIAALISNLIFSLAFHGSDYDVVIDEVADRKFIEMNDESFKSHEYKRSCQKWDWFCTKPCFWFSVAPVNVCRSSGGICFGSSVNYRYTNNHNDQFFEYLRLFEQFPSCWEALNPLVCSVRFRPCETLNMTINKKPEEVDLWQIYPEHTCLETQKRCKLLIDGGIWPSFLNCTLAKSSLKVTKTEISVTKERHVLFDDSGECKINFNKLDPLLSTGCMAPLKEITEDYQPRYTSPIVDRCYLPCRSSFVKEPEKLIVFHSILFIFSASMAILFTGFALYYACCLDFEKDQYIIFMLKWMFASIALFFLVWSYSLITPAKSACTAVGNLEVQIRREISSVRFDWCTVQWFLLNLLLVSSFDWLTLLIFHLFVRGGSGNYKWFTKQEWNSPSNFRILLAFVVFAIAFIVTLLGLYVREEYADGLTNVCYGPLYSIRSNIILYLALFILTLISIGCLVVVAQNCWKARGFGTHKSYRDRQQSQALIESDSRESAIKKRENRGDVEKQELILDEIDSEIDNSVALKSILFINACILCSIVTMFLLNYNFRFDSRNEKSAIWGKIK